MSNCPKCGKVIDENAFGLTTCKACQAVLSVDLDGNALQIEHEISQPVFQYEPIVFVDTPAETPLPPLSLELAPPEITTETIVVPAVQESDIIHHPAPIENPSDLLEGFQEPDRLAQKPLSVFKEIAKFASDFSAPSLLSYSIFIEGVENQKSEIIAVLSEKKFGWSKSELTSEIKDDRLVLKKIDPAKAVMVVKLLQKIPVRISWRQDGF